MRILVTGARGMLGTDLVCVLEEKGHEVFATDIEELDITEKEFMTKMIGDICPDVVANCAAYTDVDRAEEESDKAFLLNETGVENLAFACRKWDVELCHISTDYVFDGTKQGPYTTDDPPNPINIYGQSKLAGERRVQEIMKKFYIVRTSWLYGKYGKNFVYTILDLAKKKKELRVVSDQIGSPTWTVTLSRVIERLIRTGKYGIYHATDETRGGISWYEFARAVLKLNHLDADVVPIKTESFISQAKRPEKTVLDLTGTRIMLKGDLPLWEDSLKRLFFKFHSE